jgi:predicted dehydrogenase
LTFGRNPVDRWGHQAWRAITGPRTERCGLAPWGFPQEIAHFARCVRGAETPVETGEDGREVLKIICAAYESAGTGKRIDWPYEPRPVDKPIDLWRAG